MVLASIDYELWRGQAQNGVNLAFQVKFDLEGQGQSPPKTIGTLTKLFCTFCPNLVVLAWTRRDLWRGQARGWRTHTQTDTHTGNDNTRRPKLASGKNWPWKSKVKVMGEVEVPSHNVSLTSWTSYRLTSLWFHVKWPSHSWDTASSKFDLENPRSRS